jgi:putative ABC transport system ATP-binding protein
MNSPDRKLSVNLPHGNMKTGILSRATAETIFLKDVVKTYDTAAGKFVALDGINLQINQGEFISIVGKSGSGKTTLINMLTGIDRPSSGEIFVRGTPLHKLSEGEIASWRGVNLGVVFQFFQLLPMLTVLENIILPMDVCNIYTRQERSQRARYLLQLVGLSGMEDKFPGKLSGGQQQSAAIARALANDPPIIATDEPTGNLDTRGAEAVLTLFEELVSDGKTILMVTHDDDLAGRASRTIRISDGLIVDKELRFYS